MKKQKNNFLLGSIVVLLLGANAAAAEDNKQGISIIGNRELPKTITILPWEKAKSEALDKRPVGSILDDEVTAIDRDEFRRENYYHQLTSTGR